MINSASKFSIDDVSFFQRTTELPCEYKQLINLLIYEVERVFPASFLYVDLQLINY